MRRTKKKAEKNWNLNDSHYAILKLKDLEVGFFLQLFCFLRSISMANKPCETLRLKYFNNRMLANIISFHSFDFFARRRSTITQIDLEMMS